MFNWVSSNITNTVLYKIKQKSFVVDFPCFPEVWNRSDYRDKMMASFIYKTHMDWDSLLPQCMLRISIRYSCQLPPFLHPQFNINLSRHIILPPPPLHLPSYHCPIIIYCLRSVLEDQCLIIANTQSEALWYESLSEMYMSCRKRIHRLNLLYLLSTGQGVLWAFDYTTKSLKMHSGQWNANLDR